MVQVVPDLKSLEKNGSALNDKMVPEGAGPEPSCAAASCSVFTKASSGVRAHGL